MNDPNFFQTKTPPVSENKEVMTEHTTPIHQDAEEDKSKVIKVRILTIVYNRSLVNYQRERCFLLTKESGWRDG